MRRGEGSWQLQGSVRKAAPRNHTVHLVESVSKNSRCQCNTDSQCPSGLECVEGKAAGSYKGVCEKPRPETTPCTSSSQCAGTNCWSKHSRCQCNTDSQCPSGLECVEGKAAGSYKGVCEKKCSCPETTPCTSSSQCAGTN